MEGTRLLARVSIQALACLLHFLGARLVVFKVSHKQCLEEVQVAPRRSCVLLKRPLILPDNFLCLFELVLEVLCILLDFL